MKHLLTQKQIREYNKMLAFILDFVFIEQNSLLLLLFIQPQIRKSWDSMENANKKSSDF